MKPRKVRRVDRRNGHQVNPWPEIEARIDARTLLANLGGREAYAIGQHFLMKVTIRDVAAELGTSPSRVQQLIRRGLFALLVMGCK